MEKPVVYFTREISSEALLRIYEKLGVELHGNVAVKLSSGEANNNHYLNPQLIKPLVDKVGGTIIECNTAYKGKRQKAIEHWKVIKEHGFTDIAPVDLMDEFGEIAIPVSHGFHLKENYVGQDLVKYDSMLVLSHFKGHPMAGCGGAIKNIAIGIASAHGKAVVHGAGNAIISFAADHDSFLESMADSAQSIISYVGSRNMVYVSVANNLSVDCDCCAFPAAPEMGDIGIFASLDPVALDQACVDAVINSDDPGKKALVTHMAKKNAQHTLEACEKHNLGSRKYKLVEL